MLALPPPAGNAPCRPGALTDPYPSSGYLNAVPVPCTGCKSHAPRQTGPIPDRDDRPSRACGQCARLPVPPVGRPLPARQRRLRRRHLAAGDDGVPQEDAGGGRAHHHPLLRPQERDLQEQDAHLRGADADRRGGLPARRRVPALGAAHLDLPRPYPRQVRRDPRPDARPRRRPAGGERHLFRGRRAVVEQGRSRRHHPLLHRRPPHRRHARQPLPGRRLWQRAGLRHDPRQGARRLLLARQRQGLAGLRHPPQVRAAG